MPQPRKLHDEYFLKAKAEGYAARSAYKLLEIQDKRRLIHRGDLVLDLGCFPGSWLQVASELVNPSGMGGGGRVVGIDLTRVEIELPSNVATLVGDAFKTDAPTLLAAIAETKRDRFDVILSDMAPNTSGHGDDFLSARLCDRVLDLCPALLRPGGNLLMKILEGEPTPDVIKRAKSTFREAGTTKPKASRDVSREIFIWGKGYEPARAMVPPKPAGSRVATPAPASAAWPERPAKTPPRG
jgi:23S rRNA (uridine2552-2'-O)-methyltransferase